MTGSTDAIEWHHNLIYKGRQVNRKFCILPISSEIHKRVHEKAIKDALDRIMLNRMTDDELKEFSKAVDLKKRKKILNKTHEQIRERLQKAS